jgi:hypothetical protein
MRSSVEIIRDELVTAFEQINTANTLNGVAFRTIIHKVNTVYSGASKMVEFPQLDILFGKERMVNKNINRTVWNSEVELGLIGYFKVSTPSESEYPMTVTGEEFLHDVKRVLVDLAIKHIASGSNRWQLVTPVDGVGFQIDRWVETDKAGNLMSMFGIKAVINSFFKDVNLRGETPE